jgi:hypothetical protein
MMTGLRRFGLREVRRRTGRSPPRGRDNAVAVCATGAHLLGLENSSSTATSTPNKSTLHCSRITMSAQPPAVEVAV